MSICFANCGSVFEGNGVTCELCQETNCGEPDCNIPNWRNSGWDVCTACQNDPDKCITYLLNEITAGQNDVKKLRGMTKPKPEVPMPLNAFIFRFVTDLADDALPVWAELYKVPCDMDRCLDDEWPDKEDEWPDKEDELRVALTEAITKSWAKK